MRLLDEAGYVASMVLLSLLVIRQFTWMPDGALTIARAIGWMTTGVIGALALTALALASNRILVWLRSR